MAWCIKVYHIAYSGLILKGENFEVFTDFALYLNFNHEIFQTFYWRNYNGIYLVKWYFRGLIRYTVCNYKCNTNVLIVLKLNSILFHFMCYLLLIMYHVFVLY